MPKLRLTPLAGLQVELSQAPLLATPYQLLALFYVPRWRRRSWWHLKNAVTGASTSQGGSGNATVTSNYGATKIPVTTAIAPSNFPTAPCMGSTSIAGSAVLFGFSTGSSWEATECMTFEAARSFDQAGMHEDALAIKCTSKYSSAAPSCIKLRQQEAQRGQSDVQASREPTEPLNANLKKLSIPKPLTQ